MRTDAAVIVTVGSASNPGQERRVLRHRTYCAQGGLGHRLPRAARCGGRLFGHSRERAWLCRPGVASRPGSGDPISANEGITLEAIRERVVEELQA